MSERNSQIERLVGGFYPPEYPRQMEAPMYGGASPAQQMNHDPGDTATPAAGDVDTVGRKGLGEHRGYCQMDMGDGFEWKTIWFPCRIEGGEESEGLSEEGFSSGSDKSTAIVPASWTAGNYVALFTEEAPDVRFHDVMKTKVTGRRTRLAIDPRYVEVCEPGTLMVQGLCPDRPCRIGAVIVGGEVEIRCGWVRPRTVVVHLTGIRKGFLGMRFPNRTRRQFEANEQFLNSAYPR